MLCMFISFVKGDKKLNEIIVISASELFTNISEKLIQETRNKNRIKVIETTGKDTIKIAQNYINNGAKIFIARGRNVSLLRDNLDLPVINVQYIYEDFYYSVKNTNLNYNELLMVGFDKLFDSLTSFNKISGYNIKAVQPQSISSIENDIKENLAPNIKAVIGGLTVKKAAENLGLKYFAYDVQETSIFVALENALNLLESQEKKDQLSNTIITTINSISELIINFDKDFNIVFINDLAKNIVNDNLISNLKILINESALSSNSSLNYESILSISDVQYSVKVTPIYLNNKLENYIVVLNTVDSIQEEEIKIRIKLSSKGHVAKNNFSDIIGISKSMEKTKLIAQKYSKSTNSVLIYGQTGTGKELFAQSIHNYSPRKNNPFIAINCAALPENLLESELFGYVKGAFTGANVEGKEGVFEAAHGGTVFLDEIGEMDISMQAKLLRVLQEKEISRLGDNRIIPIDVRIISATNKNLLDLVKEKKFREDLYYRLSVLKLSLPELSKRIEDVPKLINFYIKEKYPYIVIEKDLIRYLTKLDYPGNVRQLFNIIERLVVLSDNNVISIKDYMTYINDEEMETNIGVLDEFNNNNERKTIINYLEKYDGNRKQTAEDLGISTTTLWRKMKKYKLI